jgi:hypothetical protein
MTGMCHHWQNRFQHFWNLLCSKKSVLASLECVVFSNVGFSMSGMCHNQKREFLHGSECVVAKEVSFSMPWNTSSKKSASACLECVVIGKIGFGISGICCAQRSQFQHRWNV